MGLAGEMARLAEEVVGSYERRVAAVEEIVLAAHEMIEAFRAQRDAMRAEFRERLARTASLRKRDFDGMLQGMLARQEERERTVRETMRDYLREQHSLAAELREALVRSEADEVGAVRHLLHRICAGHESCRRDVSALLGEIRSEQEEVARAVQALVSNGDSVKVSEFRGALRAIEARSGNWCPGQGSRLCGQ